MRLRLFLITCILSSCLGNQANKNVSISEELIHADNHLFRGVGLGASKRDVLEKENAILKEETLTWLDYDLKVTEDKDSSSILYQFSKNQLYSIELNSVISDSLLRCGTIQQIREELSDSYSFVSKKGDVSIWQINDSGKIYFTENCASTPFFKLIYTIEK